MSDGWPPVRDDDVPPPPTPPEWGGTPPPAGPEEGEALSDAFLTMWLHPRPTVRSIVQRRPGYAVLALAALAGVTSTLASLANRGGGESLELSGILLVALFAGPLLGLAGIWIGAWLVGLTGRWWLSGAAGGLELRTALAWSELPGVAALPLWLLGTAAFGMQLYTERSVDLVSSSPTFALFALAVGMLRVWAIVLATHAVAEVQGYRSAWKGLWNLILALLLVIAAAVAVVLAVGLVLGIGFLRR